MPTRHERRRRYFSDDSLDDDEEAGSEPQSRDAGESPASKSHARSYSPGANVDHERRLSDFIPARPLTIAIALFSGLLVIGGLQFAHAWKDSLASALNLSELAAFDLSGPRNLSQWFAATLLGIESAAAWFIYALRRHRVDDYHGRYRIWLWTALACLMASLGETTDAGALARGMLGRLAALSALSESAVWFTVLGVLLAVLGARLSLEMRRSRGSLATFFLAVTGFAAASAVANDWLLHVPAPQQVAVARGIWLSAYLGVLATLLLYARHVVRDMSGLVLAAAAKPKRTRKVLKADKARQTLVDPPQKPTPHLRTDLDDAPAVAGKTKEAAGNSASQNSGQDHGRPLSRAERRRMRREAA